MPMQRMSSGTSGARSLETLAVKRVGSNPRSTSPLTTRARSSWSSSPIWIVSSSVTKRAIRMTAAYARGARMSFGGARASLLSAAAGRGDADLEPAALGAVALRRFHRGAEEAVQVTVGLHLDDLDVLGRERELALAGVDERVLRDVHDAARRELVQPRDVLLVQPH